MRPTYGRLPGERSSPANPLPRYHLSPRNRKVPGASCFRRWQQRRFFRRRGPMVAVAGGMGERCLHYRRDRSDKLGGSRVSGLEMDETEIDLSENSGVETTSSHQMPLLLLFFVASGCAALIYEVVWFDLLRLVVGASSISLAIVLTGYMGGMCLGSLAFPRWVSPHHPPLRVYAYLEAAIAVFGVVLLGLLPIVGKIYFAIG